MAIVDTTKPITAESCNQMLQQLAETYPFCRLETLTQSAFGRPVRILTVGNGRRNVIYTAAHHANEWITALVLLKFAEDLAAAIANNTALFGKTGGEIAETATIHIIPMIDPDGVDLVVGAIDQDSRQFRLAETLSRNYPAIPFPEGWKADLLGVDLNLQYPAGWLQAREIKFSQGYTQPGPRDFVGLAPLSQREPRALAEYTRSVDPALVLAYHSQGKEIYWQFADIEVPGARELGEEFARVSGYTLADVPYNSSFAGYKDWFIKWFQKPGYTIEVGEGENPLPIEQFDEIYRDNLGILITAATFR